MGEVEPVELPAPVPASQAVTGPVQSIILRERPFWEVVAERACMLMLGVFVGMAFTAALVFP